MLSTTLHSVQSFFRMKEIDALDRWVLSRIEHPVYSIDSMKRKGNAIDILANIEFTHDPIKLLQIKAIQNYINWMTQGLCMKIYLF